VVYFTSMFGFSFWKTLMSDSRVFVWPESVVKEK